MDNVNKPSHYNQGSIQCIDALKSALTREELIGFLRANIIKYLWRTNHKNGIEDLKKAKWYLEYYIALLEGKEFKDGKTIETTSAVVLFEEMPRSFQDFKFSFQSQFLDCEVVKKGFMRNRISICDYSGMELFSSFELNDVINYAINNLGYKPQKKQ